MPSRLGVALAVCLVAACGGAAIDGSEPSATSAAATSVAVEDPAAPETTKAPAASETTEATDAVVETTQAPTVAESTTTQAPTVAESTTTQPASGDKEVIEDVPAFDTSSSFACESLALSEGTAFELWGRVPTSDEMALIAQCPPPTHDYSCVEEVLGMDRNDSFVLGRSSPTAEELSLVEHCRFGGHFDQVGGLDGDGTVAQPASTTSGVPVAFDLQSTFECVMEVLGPDVAWGLGDRMLPAQMLVEVGDCPMPTHDQWCIFDFVGKTMLDNLVTGRYHPTAEDAAMVQHCRIAEGSTWVSWLGGTQSSADAPSVGVDQAFGDTAPDQDWDYPADDGQGQTDEATQSGPPCLRGDHGDALGPECNVPLPTLGPGVTRGELVGIRGDPPARVMPTTSGCEVVEGGRCAELRWEPVAPLLAGDFTSIQIAPTDPNIIYAGIDSNDMSLYKSINGGASWQVTHVTGHTSGVAISPTDPDTVIYTNLEAPTQHTTDGGATWSAVMGGIAQKPYTTVSFSPSAANVAYTANVPGPSRGGMWPPPPAEIYRSDDAGATWTLTGACDTCGAIQTLVVEPGDPDVLWVAADGGLQVSRDRGASWSGNLLDWVDWRSESGRGEYTIGVALRPDDPRVMLAATAEKGLFRSTDGGVTWSESNSGLATSMLHRLAFAASDPAVVYLSTHEGVYRSGDAGQTWTYRSTGLPYLFVNAIAVDPTDADIAYVGTAAEVNTTHTKHYNPGMHEGQNLYKTTDGGRTWFPSGDNIYERKVTQMSTHPLVPYVLWAGGESGRGGFATTDAGESWAVSPSTTAHYPMVYAFSHSLPTEMYLTAWSHHDELVKSTDGGASWFGLTLNVAAGIGEATRAAGLWDETDPKYHLHGLAVAPSDPSIVYVGSVHDTMYPDVNFTLFGIHIFRSDDGGATFVERDIGFPIESISSVNVIVVHPDNPDIVYAMTTLHESDNALGIFKSVDGGLAWTSVNDGLDLRTNDLQMDAVDPDTLYAATEGGVYKTTDAAAAWSRTSDGIPEQPVIDLAIDPVNPLVLYAITPDDLYRTKDGGGHWYPVSLGIPLLVPIDSSDDMRGRSTVGHQGHREYGGTFVQDRSLEIDATGRVVFVVAKTSAEDDKEDPLVVSHLYRAVLEPLRATVYSYRVLSDVVAIESTSNIYDLVIDENNDELRFTAAGPVGTVASTTVTIPVSLLAGPFVITVDSQPVDIQTQGDSVSFSHSHRGQSEVIIRASPAS